MADPNDEDTHTSEERPHLSPDDIPSEIPEAQSGPPSVDTANGADSARERIYSTLVQTREPTDAASMAEKADCHPDTARTYLEWFARLGLAHRHDGRPTTYERNEAYFEWRYVNELAERHTQAELREHVQEIEKELEHLRDTYDAPNPGLVDAQAHATEDTPVEDVWNELSRWATLEEELRLLDRARRRVVTNRSSHAIRS